MKLPRWLRRDRVDSASPDPSTQPSDPRDPALDPATYVRWVPADENPFGVEVLDCALFVRSMVATTSNPEIANRFAESRGSRGEHCQGVTGGATYACQLAYPYDRHAEGPVFMAQQMEDKWDIFLVGGRLCFCRSWTGAVIYRAEIAFDASRAIVTSIHSLVDRDQPDDPVATVDFLIKSHVFGLVAPHPLTGAPSDQERDLAYWSFSAFGRRGVFGTLDDVTPLQVRRDEEGRCTLMRGVDRTTE
jgi:hypothetical protein